jgi:hypothetical protein
MLSENLTISNGTTDKTFNKVVDKNNLSGVTRQDTSSTNSVPILLLIRHNHEVRKGKNPQDRHTVTISRTVADSTHVARAQVSLTIVAEDDALITDAVITEMTSEVISVVRATAVEADVLPDATRLSAILRNEA